MCRASNQGALGEIIWGQLGGLLARVATTLPILVVYRETKANANDKYRQPIQISRHFVCSEFVAGSSWSLNLT